MYNQNDLVTLPNGVKITPQEWEDLLDNALTVREDAPKPPGKVVILTRVVESRGCFG